MSFASEGLYRGDIYNSLQACLDDASIKSHFLGSGSSSFNVDFRLPSSRHPAFLNWYNQNLLMQQPSEETFVTTLFGELGGEQMGTVIGLAGENAMPSGNKAYSNDAGCRNAYALRMPTLPTVPIYNAFQQQTSQFKVIIENLTSNRCGGSPLTLTPIREVDCPPETVLVVHGCHTYINTFAKAVGMPRNRLSVLPVQFDRQWQKANSAFLTLRGGPYYAKSSDLQKTYPLSSLPIFSDLPKLFIQQYALRQPEVYNAGNQLISPWDLQKHVREGVLCLVEGFFRLRGRYDEEQSLMFIAQVLTIVDEAEAKVWDDECS
ncbi:hypothetical protein BJ165DRAFT_1529781 [Panaeolus papilionaceus]|nr:hypothetical protein BJ165DRAFT_1529781 [Panaeolus papilionaceus]